MALLNVDVEVSFEDAGPTIVTRTYPLGEQFDTTAEGASIASISAIVTSLIAALNVLTWDKITGHAIIIRYVDTGAAPAVTANNSVHAFTRCLDGNGEPCGFDVPAWDDLVFDKTSQQMLSDAYNVAAGAVADLLANNGIGGYHSGPLTVEWSQNRGSKTRNRVT